MSSRWVKIDSKMAAKETTEEEVMHDDWVFSPDFPSLIALGNVHSFGKRIESCSRAQNDLRLSNDVVASTPFKFADTYVDRLGKLPSKEQQLSRTQHFILRAHAAIFIQYNTAHAEHRWPLLYHDRIVSYQHLQVGSSKLPFIQVEIVVVKNT